MWDALFRLLPEENGAEENRTEDIFKRDGNVKNGLTNIIVVRFS